MMPVPAPLLTSSLLLWPKRRCYHACIPVAGTWYARSEREGDATRDPRTPASSWRLLVTSLLAVCLSVLFWTLSSTATGNSVTGCLSLDLVPSSSTEYVTPRCLCAAAPAPSAIVSFYAGRLRLKIIAWNVIGLTNQLCHGERDSRPGDRGGTVAGKGTAGLQLNHPSGSDSDLCWPPPISLDSCVATLNALPSLTPPCTSCSYRTRKWSKGRAPFWEQTRYLNPRGFVL